MRSGLLFLLFFFVFNNFSYSGNITINGSNVSFDTEAESVVSTDQVWHYSIGDNIKWAQVNFDDSKWDSIRFPVTSTEMISHKYNGNVWFRTKVMINAKDFSKNIR